jgi:ornithine decarboxylase
VKGVAFHTGSGGVMFDTYESSLLDARKIFDTAEKMGLKRMDLLDIGGGFSFIYPGTGKNFNEVAPLIASMIDKVFPETHIRVIAEPGRYVSQSVGYLAS